MRCYRYMDYEYGLQAFETGLFKVTKPSEFNDPYDCYGYENLEQSMMQVVQEVASLAKDRDGGNTDC